MAFLTVTCSSRVVRYSLCCDLMPVRMPHALWSTPSGYSQLEWSLPVSQCMHQRTLSIEEVTTILFIVITRPPEGDVVYMNYEPATFFCAYLATTELLNFPEPNTHTSTILVRLLLRITAWLPVMPYLLTLAACAP